MESSKSEKKQLRALADAVYEAEARRLLDELDREFDRWRAGEILSSELLTTIHEFHQHQSRQLWSMYQGVSDSMVVARGIALGLLAESDVPPTIRARLDPGYRKPDAS